MLMNQTSLKKLIYSSKILNNPYQCLKMIPKFTQFPGAKDSLIRLSKLKLHCKLGVYSEFFYQLSQICHNIQSISIEYANTIPNGLNGLISSQNRLKSLSLINLDWLDIIPLL